MGFNDMALSGIACSPRGDTEETGAGAEPLDGFGVGGSGASGGGASGADSGGESFSGSAAGGESSGEATVGGGQASGGTRGSFTGRPRVFMAQHGFKDQANDDELDSQLSYLRENLDGLWGNNAGVSFEEEARL